MELKGYGVVPLVATWVHLAVLLAVPLTSAALLKTGRPNQFQATPSQQAARVSTQQERPQIIRTVEVEGVRLNLTIERSVYRRGEVVRVTAIAENLSNVPVVYWKANLDDPPIYVFVDTPFFGPYTLRNPADPQVVRPALGSASLQPGRKIVREVTWDQMMPPGLKGPVQSPPGQYTVSAVLNLGGSDPFTKNKPLRVIASVTIKGGKPIIPVQEALESALRHPKVSSWLEAHGGLFVLRFHGDQKYFTLTQGGLQELAGNLNIESTRGSKGGGIANCAIHLEPGPRWRLNMSGGKRRGSYSAMSVLLNATNGKVLRIEPQVN